MPDVSHAQPTIMPAPHPHTPRRACRTPPRTTDTPSQDLSDFNFKTFFSTFPLDSPISRYFSDLDLQQLLRNLEVAAIPLASVPCYCRGETLRKRDAVQRELKTLDEAFAAIEQNGVDVGGLRSDLAMARVRIERCIQKDDEWSARESAGPSTSIAPSPPRHHHRHTQSDPGPSSPAYSTPYSPSRSSVHSAPAALPRSSWSPPAPPAAPVARTMSMSAAYTLPSHAPPHAAYGQYGHALSTGAVPTREVRYYHQ